MLDTKPHYSVNLLLYFFTSCAVLIFSGLAFKVLFVVYNHHQFSNLDLSEIAYALIWGMRFDLASAAFFSLISCIILWLAHRLRSPRNPALALLLVMLFVQLSLQISDTMYFAESGRHVSYEMRDVLADASGLFMTAITKHTLFLSIGYLLVFLVIFLTLNLLRKALSVPANGIRMSKYRGQNEVSLFTIILLTVIILRGGVTGVPQSVISAFKIGDAQQAIITMNGAYSVVYGVLNSAKEINRVNVTLPENIDTAKTLKSLYPTIPAKTAVSDENIKKYNLIFILMEGWPADGMSAYGYEATTTPFFASLKERSLSPLGAIAGGVRTTEGIYTTFCSQQNPLGKTVAQSSLQNNTYECLPDMLKQLGWHTAFFQGSHKETSGTGAFAQSLGFAESFAKDDMPAGRFERNYWGAHDPDIYDFLLDHLDTMPQPFLVGVNTNSTHDIQVPPGVEPFFGNANSKQKHQSILHFADQSMREFFEKIQQKPYYKDTIFVLVSDHTGGIHKTVAARYFIPGIIYAEDIVPVKTVNRYVSQRDFAPTVLDILGLPASGSFSGKSFSSEGQNIYFADYFDAGSVGWLSGGLLVETSVANPFDMHCYSIEKGLSNAYSVTCDENYQNISTQSLVFTSYSQELLFKGKTKLFYEFTDK